MKRVGRARTVLVYQSGDTDRAVLTEVIALAVPHAPQRMTFKPPLVPDESTRGHIVQVILPLVDTITTSLGLNPQCFELTGVNIDAAAIHDVGIEISGYSGDLPICLALLSASLQLELSGDMVSTGHIASPEGDLAVVRALPAKLRAAAANKEVKVFVCPATDGSMVSLTPLENESLRQTISEVKAAMVVHQVRDISSFLRTVIEEDSLALSCVTAGFIDVVPAVSVRSRPVDDAVHFLCDDNPGRFWRSLESAAIAGNVERVRILLSAYIRHYSIQNVYPRGTGRRLVQILASVPPGRRKGLRTEGLVDEALCLELGRTATAEDFPDLNEFYEAASGKIFRCTTNSRTPEGDSAAFGSLESSSVLDYLLQELDERAISERVTLPLSSARAQYTLRSVVTDSYEEFMDTVAAYYLFLLRHHNSLIGNVHPAQVGPDALAVLERAFERHGGLAASRAEARDGVRGGLRLILDRMTDQFIVEQKEKYVRMLLRETLDPLDWDLKVAVTKALMDQLGVVVSNVHDGQPVERYAAHCETLVRAYADSHEQVKNLLRTM